MWHMLHILPEKKIIRSTYERITGSFSNFIITNFLLVYLHGENVFFSDAGSNIRNTRKRVSSEFPNNEKWVEKKADFFSINF